MMQLLNRLSSGQLFCLFIIIVLATGSVLAAFANRHEDDDR